MAASKPTSWLLSLFYWPFSLSNCLRTLAYDLGCFPFNFEPYHPKFVYRSTNAFAFGVSLELVKLWATLIQRVLYLGPLSIYALPKQISRKTSYSNLIGLSPLGTVCPGILPIRGFGPPRAAKPLFNLPMPRSSDFGSNNYDTLFNFATPTLKSLSLL